MIFFIIIAVIILFPIALVILLLSGGGGSGSAGHYDSGYGTGGEDYYFPSDRTLHERLEAGYYDDDPDMLESHDPDRFYDLYGDDPDIYDDNDF